MMTFDGLTQIYNKRYFHETLEREVSRSRRYGRELALVMFDIDFFKQKNDTFGHLAGDAILRELATVVRWKLRREDVFARVGGEEFAILTPRSVRRERASIRESAGRRRSNALSLREAHGSHHHQPRVRRVARGEDSADALYKRADTALYAAKQAKESRRPR